MFSWLKKIDLTIVALVLGPALIIIGLVAFRNQLWGHTLNELNRLVHKHDDDLKGMEQRQQEMLRRQQEVLEAIKKLK